MGIELPAELVDVAAKAGVSWPEADEDKMREAARAWREAGARMGALTGDADNTAHTALATITGDTANAATRHWSTFVQADTGHLTSTVVGCAAAANRLDHAADQVGAAKVEIVRQLVALAKNSDAATSAAAAGNPNALLGLDAAVRGTAANLANLTNSLVSSVQPHGGDVGQVRDVVNANPGSRGPLDPLLGGGPSGPAGSGLLSPGQSLAAGPPGPGQAGSGLLGSGGLLSPVQSLVGGGGPGGQAGAGLLDPVQNLVGGGPAGQPGSGLLSPVQNLVGGGPGQAGSGVLGQVTGAVQGVVHPGATPGGPIGGLLNPVTDLVIGVAQTASGVVHGAVETTANTVQGVSDLAQGKGGPIAAAVHGAVDPAAGAVDSAAGAVRPGGEHAAQNPVVQPIAEPVHHVAGPGAHAGGAHTAFDPVLANAPTPPSGIPASSVQAASAAVLDLPAQSAAAAPPAAPIAGSPLSGAPVGGGAPAGGGGSFGGSPVGGSPLSASPVSGSALGGSPVAAVPPAAAAVPGPRSGPGGAFGGAGQPGSQSGPGSQGGPGQAGQPGNAGQQSAAGPAKPTPAGAAAAAAAAGQGSPTGPGANPAPGRQSGADPVAAAPPESETDLPVDRAPTDGRAGPTAQTGFVGGLVPVPGPTGGPGQAPAPGGLPPAPDTGGRGPSSPAPQSGRFTGAQVPDHEPPQQQPGAHGPRQRTERDTVVALFRVHLFPIGHMPVASAGPARQVAPPPQELDYAAGMRFEPDDHPRADLVDLSTCVEPGERPPAREAPHLLDGYDPLAGQHERDWDRRFLVRPYDPNSAQPTEYAWPPGELYPEGGTAPAEAEVLDPGAVLDRFGHPEGRVFSADATPFARRSLPPAHATAGHYRYRVLRPLPVWRAVSAPWFGQPGGGERLRTTQSAADLVALGYLADISWEDAR